MWSIVKKQRLVDSILRKWHVPPIHVVEKKSEANEVLDGQQRLVSIRDFINNLFPVNGSIEPRDEKIANLDGLYWSGLPEEVRDDFFSHTIRVLTLNDHSPEEAAEMFFRLNQPANLTAPEQRNAYFGLAREQVKGLVDEMLNLGIYKDNIGFSNARMAYDDVLAKVLMSLEEETLNVKITSSVVAAKYRSGSGFEKSSIDLLGEAMLLLSEAIGGTKKLRRLNKATLYSWLIFYCEACHKTTTHEEKFIKLPVISFFDNFYEIRGLDNSSRISIALHNIFQDRSQSRVADTSSVKLRDFALWGLFWSDFLTVYELGNTSFSDFGERMSELAENDADVLPIEIMDQLGWGSLLV